MILQFDDIPDISHVAGFLSENNLDVASNEEVWDVARHYEELPNLDNIFLELTYNKIPQAIKNYFLNPSNKDKIVERIESLIPIQGQYSYAINPELIKNLSGDERSLLLSVAVKQYQEKKESIADIINDYEIMGTYINNLNSDVYINGEIMGSKDDFMKYTISAMLYEYRDEFSLSKTLEQVFSNPSKHLTLKDDAVKKKKVKP